MNDINGAMLGNILTIVILGAIFVLVYCKITHKTFSELIKEIIGLFKDKTQEVIKK